MKLEWLSQTGTLKIFCFIQGKNQDFVQGHKNHFKVHRRITGQWEEPLETFLGEVN